jgi:hypothetical protein
MLQGMAMIPHSKHDITVLACKRLPRLTLQIFRIGKELNFLQEFLNIHDVNIQIFLGRGKTATG